MTFEDISTLDWQKEDGLLPAVVQHADSGAVLMLGYMNREALRQTLETGRVYFYSRSRRTQWMKGETSGNVLNVVHDRLAADLPVGKTRVVFTIETRGEAHLKEILSHLSAKGFEVKERLKG